MKREEFEREMRLLREQTRSDFQWTTQALGQVASDLANISERVRQVEGRMRLLDQRFDRMLSAVEGRVGGLQEETRCELDDVKRRLEALERRSPPAA